MLEQGKLREILLRNEACAQLLRIKLHLIHELLLELLHVHSSLGRHE